MKGGDFRLRVFIKAGQEGDHKIRVDARKVALKRAMGRMNGMYFLDFREIRLEFGRDLLFRWWEELMYLFPEDRVKQAVKEYFEKL